MEDEDVLIRDFSADNGGEGAIGCNVKPAIAVKGAGGGRAAEDGLDVRFLMHIRLKCSELTLADDLAVGGLGGFTGCRGEGEADEEECCYFFHEGSVRGIFLFLK